MLVKTSSIKYVILAILLFNISMVDGINYPVSVYWDEVQLEIIPSGRFDATLDYDPTNEVALLFGGYTNNGLDESTWMLDPVDNSWTELRIEGPEARYAHSSVFIPTLEKFLMFGGLSDADELLFETWLFDASTMEWTEIAIEQYPFTSAFGELTLIPSENSIYYFGGIGSDGSASDQLWKFDPLSASWDFIETEDGPQARYNHVLQYDPISDRLILFGGYSDKDGNLADTWVYDYHTNTWEELELSNSPNSFGHYSWYTGIASGYDETLNLTIFTKSFVIWTLDVKQEEWIQIENRGRGDYVDIQFGDQMAYINDEDKFVQFSGLTSLLQLEDFQVELRLENDSTSNDHTTTTSETSSNIPTYRMSWNLLPMIFLIFSGAQFYKSKKKNN